MNVYEYIAVSNPHIAEALINKYGYQTTGVTTVSDLGKCLQDVVSDIKAQNENDAVFVFRDIMNNHPDKDVILELFGTPQQQAKPMPVFSNMDGSNDGTGCKGCNKAYSSMTGADVVGGVAQHTNIANLTSIALVGAAFLLAAAIITHNK